MKNKISLMVILIIIVFIVTMALVYLIRMPKNNQSYLNIYYEPAGLAEDDPSKLEEIPLKINNLEKIKSVVSIDNDKLYLQMKEYMYSNGLINATEAEYQDYEKVGQNVILRFVLNDVQRTNLYLKLNPNSNDYIFLNDYNQR